MKKKMKVYLIAGEASGDLLGARLMRALKRQMSEGVEFCGIGGESMAGEGLQSLFNISDLSVMGLLEVIPSIPKILKHLKELVNDIREKQPDIVMTIDSYSFSARVHQKLKEVGFEKPHVHCVAPQVWAWKKGRAQKIGNFVDHLFCLLPNEKDYFEPYGMKTTFIGHPVIESESGQGDAGAFKQKHQIDSTSKIVCLLPGSRRNEIKYLLPIFREAVEVLQTKIPSLFVVIPTVETVADKIKEALKDWAVPHVIVSGEKARYDAFAASDVAIAASGTVSIELAMAGVPHLIAYKVSPLTGWIARKLLKIRFVNLLNLMVDKEVIPELLQENCTVDQIVMTVQKLLKHPQQETQKSLQKLGFGSPWTPSDKLANEIQRLAQQEGKDPVASCIEAGHPSHESNQLKERR